MAGITRIFSIGGGGGFGGSDGVNPIYAQIWQGEGNRQWFEAGTPVGSGPYLLSRL